MEHTLLCSKLEFPQSTHPPHPHAPESRVVVAMGIFWTVLALGQAERRRPLGAA